MFAVAIPAEFPVPPSSPCLALRTVTRRAKRALREQKQSFVSVVSGYLMDGALTGSSSNWSVQKIAEAVNQIWIVTLDAVLFLSQPQDFRDQMGRLQEEIKAANHLIIFYPKFHCELIIDRFWCAANGMRGRIISTRWKD